MSGLIFFPLDKGGKKEEPKGQRTSDMLLSDYHQDEHHGWSGWRNHGGGKKEVMRKPVGGSSQGSSRLIE